MQDMHNDKESGIFSQNHLGVPFTDWRVFYQHKHGLSNKEITSLMRFYVLVQTFPALIHSKKSWYWMKEHMQASRLQSQIFLYYREKWEMIQDVADIEKLRKRGYDFKEKSFYISEQKETGAEIPKEEQKRE